MAGPQSGACQRDKVEGENTGYLSGEGFRSPKTCLGSESEGHRSPEKAGSFPHLPISPCLRVCSQQTAKLYCRKHLSASSAQGCQASSGQCLQNECMNNECLHSPTAFLNPFSPLFHFSYILQIFVER